jgi:hypothetical protein
MAAADFVEKIKQVIAEKSLAGDVNFIVLAVFEARKRYRDHLDVLSGHSWMKTRTLASVFGVQRAVMDTCDSARSHSVSYVSGCHGSS